MRPFAYTRASGAAAAVAAAQGDFAYLAGGHTLIPAMKARLRAPDLLVDLGAAGLSAISLDGDRLWVGATATHAAVEASDVVRGAIPGLADMAARIGDPAVRARGTLGGAVANNDPSADYPAACLALDAVIETDRARHAADDFFQGMFTTALDEAELITRVGFRVPDACRYEKFRHPASRYAIAGVCVARLGGGVRVAVTGAAYSVFRWSEAEAALSAEFSQASVAGLVLDRDDLNSDIHAAADYRAHLAGVMLRRAVMAMES